MPIKINGAIYYRTAEACRIAGISRNTFFRWVKQGLFDDVKNLDRRGWRLFTVADLTRLKKEANQVTHIITKPGTNRSKPGIYSKQKL